MSVHCAFRSDAAQPSQANEGRRSRYRELERQLHFFSSSQITVAAFDLVHLPSMLRTTVLSAYNAASCSTLSCTSAANCSSAYVWSRQASSSSKGSTLESTNRPRQATPSSSSGTYTPSSAAPTQSSPDLPPSPATAPPEPKYTTSQTQFSSEQDKLPLPWLDRPLGVKEKPLKGGVQRTRSERIDAYLTSGRGEERKRIVQSAAQGYFHDFHSLRSHGGKTWRAPNTLIRQDRALYFPAMEGTRLSNKESTNTVDMMEGRVSVVAILNSRVSEVSQK